MPTLSHLLGVVTEVGRDLVRGERRGRRVSIIAVIIALVALVVAIHGPFKVASWSEPRAR
jgi:hypothetical protein